MSILEGDVGFLEDVIFLRLVHEGEEGVAGETNVRRVPGARNAVGGEAGQGKVAQLAFAHTGDEMAGDFFEDGMGEPGAGDGAGGVLGSGVEAGLVYSGLRIGFGHKAALERGFTGL